MTERRGLLIGMAVGCVIQMVAWGCEVFASPDAATACLTPPLTTWAAVGVPGQAILPSRKSPEKKPWPQDLTSNVVPAGSFDTIRDASVHLLSWNAGPSRICILVHNVTGLEVDEDEAYICAISNIQQPDKKGAPNTCKPIGGGICAEFNGWTPAVAWFAEGEDGWRLMPGERLIARVTGPMEPTDVIMLRYSGWRRPLQCLDEVGR